eukprot:g3759.t1
MRMSLNKAHPSTHLDIVGRNPAYQIGNNVTRAMICCSACGHFICRVQSILGLDRTDSADDVNSPHSFRRLPLVSVTLEDSYVTHCIDANIGTLDIKRTVRDGEWLFDVCHIVCSSCTLFLGVRIIQMRPVPETSRGRNTSQYDNNHGISVSDPHPDIIEQGKERLRRRKEAEKVAIAEQFMPNWKQRQRRRTRSMSLEQGEMYKIEENKSDVKSLSYSSTSGNGPTKAPTISIKYVAPGDDRLEVQIGQSFVGNRYVRVKDARTHAPQIPRIPIKCKGCRTILSYTDQVLCPERRWSFADSPEGNPPEPACYMNSLVPGSISVAQPYAEMLAQGPFDMADVHCANPKCGQQVGYMFCHDRSDRHRNKHQNSRYGLVNSRTFIECANSIQPFPPPENNNAEEGIMRRRRRRRGRRNAQ